MQKSQRTNLKKLILTELPLRPDWVRSLVILLLYGITARYVLVIFLMYPGINGFYAAMFPDMIYGQAHRPFVNRVLLPSIVRGVTVVTPEPMQEAITTVLTREYLGGIARRAKWEKPYLFEYFVASILMFLCFLGLAFVLRALIRTFYKWPDFVAQLAPVGGLLLVPLFFYYYSYIYDPPNLLLFSLAVLLIANRQHLHFYPVLALATMNKETSILLLALFFAREFKVLPHAQLAGHLAMQAGLWVGIQLMIRSVYGNNEGVYAGFHWTDHNAGLLFEPPAVITLTVCALWFLVRYRWHTKPVFLRQGLLITLVPLVVLTAIFGYLDELRDYHEALPFIFLLSLPTIIETLKISSSDVEQKAVEQQAATHNNF